MQLRIGNGSATRKLAIGFVIGALLIACTLGARSLLESGTTTPASSDNATATPEGAAPKKAFIEDATSPTEVLMSLLVVVGVMIVVLWGISRLMRRARLAPGRKRSLGLVDAMSLGSKRQVFVVSYKDRTLILGCGGEGIQLLAEYERDDFATPEAEEQPAATPPRQPERPADLTAMTSDPADKVEISDKGREADALSMLPAGAHRVPPAFRHLLKETVERAES
jgi:flagellar biogenesis protein FliO